MALLPHCTGTREVLQNDIAQRFSHHKKVFWGPNDLRVASGCLNGPSRVSLFPNPGTIMSPDTKEPEAQAPLSDSQARERLTEVFRREYRRLVERAHGRLSRHKKDRWDEAEEIVTRAFQKVLEKVKGAVVIGNLVGYWREAVRNELRNEYRHDDMRRRTQPALDYELEHSFPSPESLCLNEEQQRVLQQVCEGLPDKCRAAFRWALWEGLTPRDIVTRFAGQGIEIGERQVSRYLDAGSEACRRALEALEDRLSCEDHQKEGVQ